MSGSIYSYQGQTVLQDLDDNRQGNYRRGTRKERKEKRVMALKIINRLTDTYGDLDNVPEVSLDAIYLYMARMWLGVFNDEFVKIDVTKLRQRIVYLARRHKMTQTEVYQLLAYGLDIGVQTIKDKTYNNRFTGTEADLVWRQLKKLEEIKDLKIVIQSYEREIIQKQKRRKRSV